MIHYSIIAPKLCPAQESPHLPYTVQTSPDSLSALLVLTNLVPPDTILSLSKDWIADETELVKVVAAKAGKVPPLSTISAVVES